MKPLIIYHDHCADGFGAAFAAWCRFGDDAEYLPAQYGQYDTPQAIAECFDCSVSDRDVYILDFSLKRPAMDWLMSHAGGVVWLDHHKTAFEMWAGEERNRYESDSTEHYILLDNNKSGALLAWEHFHPEKEVPHIIKLVDDRDRWVFEYPESRALHAGLHLYPKDFRQWAQLVPAMGGSSSALGEVVRQGATVLSIYDEQIVNRVKVAERCRVVPAVLDSLDSYKAPWVWGTDDQCGAHGLAVNSPIHQSEIGNALATASGTYGLVWYYDSQTKRANVSLRSKGDYDVSAIAKAFGGGGHKNAAGFNIDMNTLLEWLK